MRTLTVGNVTVSLYGVVLAASAVLCALLTCFSARKQKDSRKAVGLFALLALALGFLGAWLGYGLVNLNWVLEHGLQVMLRETSRRLLPYGALLGCVLAAFLSARAAGGKAAALLDAMAAPAALFILLARLAEPLAGMGYGRNIYDWFDPWMEQSMIAWDDPSALFRFPFAVQDYYSEWNFNISLPEALTALALVILCLSMKKRRAGGKFLLTVLICAALQITWESMRQDAVMRWGFVRANQLLSAVAVIVCTVVCYAALPRGSRNGWRLLPVSVGELLCAGVAMAMEFALEKKIGFLVRMRMDACYLVMLAACAAMIAVALPLWRKAFPLGKD